MRIQRYLLTTTCPGRQPTTEMTTILGASIAREPSMPPLMMILLPIYMIPIGDTLYTKVLCTSQSANFKEWNISYSTGRLRCKLLPNNGWSSRTGAPTLEGINSGMKHTWCIVERGCQRLIVEILTPWADILQTWGPLFFGVFHIFIFWPRATLTHLFFHLDPALDFCTVHWSWEPGFHNLYSIAQLWDWTQLGLEHLSPCDAALFSSNMVTSNFACSAR